MFLLVFATTFGAACGGGARKAAPADWVADICSAARDLRNDRATVLLKFFEVDSQDGPAMYDGFIAYTEAYAKSLDTFSKTTKNAGEPKVDGGSKVAAAVQKFAADERAANDDALSRARTLDRQSSGAADQIDAIFFALKFADLHQLLKDSGAAGAENIIQMIEAKPTCASDLFAQQ